MLRDVLKKHNIGMDPGFRLRGEEHGRIEAVTDTGFALGISGFTYVLYIPAMLIFGRKARSCYFIWPVRRPGACG
jgi:hypothetical protein